MRGSETPSPEAVAAVSDAARDMTELARETEPEVSADLNDIVEELGGWREGEKTAVKSEASLTRKMAQIYDDVAASGQEPDLGDIQEEIRDSFRYSVVFPAESYVDSALTLAEQMQAKGYEQVKSQPTFTATPGAAMGLNTAWYDGESGLQFEVQVHTPESFTAKVVSHPYYLGLRELAPGDEAFKPVGSKVDALMATVPVPEGVERLPAFRR